MIERSKVIALRAEHEAWLDGDADYRDVVERGTLVVEPIVGDDAIEAEAVETLRRGQAANLPRRGAP